MSADEIRSLADLRKRFMPEHWQAVVLWPEHWEQVRDALLAYAAMVERCEAEIALTYETNYTYKRLNYILRGDAGKEEK